MLRYKTMKSTLEQWKLRDRVKSLHHKRFDVKLNHEGKTKITEDTTWNDFVVFSKKGFIIERKNYETYFKWHYKMGENEYTIYENDKNNKETRIEKCIFNKNGDKIQSLNYGSDENQYHEKTYRYNKEGKLIQENHYDAEGNLEHYTYHEYDGCINVKMVKEYMFGEEYLITRYRYNLNDDFTEDVVEKQIIYMDDSNNSKSYSIKYKYDKDRNVINEQWLDEFQFITNNYSLSWFFDTHNNWVKKVAYKGDKEIWFEERKIEYY
jgi:hypothetical protein